MAISKGIDNLFKPSIINFILALCLIIILILIFMKTKTLDLFYNPITPEYEPQYTPNINLLTNNDFLSTFINKYIKNIQQQNSYMKKLEQQQNTIDNLSQQVANLINPST